MTTTEEPPDRGDAEPLPGERRALTPPPPGRRPGRRLGRSDAVQREARAHAHSNVARFALPRSQPGPQRRPRASSADALGSTSGGASSFRRDRSSVPLRRRRPGVRILVCTANLGNAHPDEESLDAWIPRGGEVRRILRPDLPASSVVGGGGGGVVGGAQGAAGGRSTWGPGAAAPNPSGTPWDVDDSGRVEVLAVGMQEAVPESSAFEGFVATTGLTGKLTGHAERDRHLFRDALGDELGKPIDDLRGKVSKALAGNHADQAAVGGTKKLQKAVVGHVGEGYELMAQYQRGEMVFYLFVREDVAKVSSVSEVRAANCGVGKMFANKGGIHVRLDVAGTRLSFVSCHLNAHEGAEFFAQRLLDVSEVLKGTKDQTSTCHHAFFFGDLNFRFELPPVPTPSGELTARTKEERSAKCLVLLEREDWDAMYEHDELARALRERRTLVGFRTLPLRTPPTFKCLRGRGWCGYDPKRTPSYTDRILWKSAEETRSVEALVYEPCPDFATSDHKPVRGLFFLPDRLPLDLDPERTVLDITLRGLRCDILKPLNHMQGEVYAYLKFRTEPASLLVEGPRETRKRRTNALNNGCPSWSEEMALRVDVSSEEKVRGAFLCVQVVNEDIPMIIKSPFGAVVLDLERIVRMSQAVPSWCEGVERSCLRDGKEVGTLRCEQMDVAWSDGSSWSERSDQCDNDRRRKSTATREVLASMFQGKPVKNTAEKVLAGT
ncbi:hypothetical protein ACHAWF_018885 [Thalassiosira exigua]